MASSSAGTFESEPLAALLALNEKWASNVDPELLKRNAKGQSPKVQSLHLNLFLSLLGRFITRELIIRCGLGSDLNM
jgi:hypothetical protein